MQYLSLVGQESQIMKYTQRESSQQKFRHSHNCAFKGFLISWPENIITKHWRFMELVTNKPKFLHGMPSIKQKQLT